MDISAANSLIRLGVSKKWGPTSEALQYPCGPETFKVLHNMVNPYYRLGLFVDVWW